MTKKPWEAERILGREQALQLALALIPDIAPDAFERVGSGWDVDVWRAGDIAFRFPRRAMGASTLSNELAVLPELAGALPLAIPMPLAVGHASASFPWPYFAHRFVRGVALPDLELSLNERADLAEPLAATLRALHATPSKAAKPDAIRNDLSVVSERALARLPELAREPWSEWLSEIRNVLTAVPEPSADAPCLIHGDVYYRHLLVDETRRKLVALIDWGDACLGDRAVDLAAVYTTLPTESRARFYAVYGDVDAKTRERARFFAIARHGVSVLAYALDLGDACLEREASFALENALSAD